MIKQTSVPRYYIRDYDTNDIWCFNALTYTGKKTPAVTRSKAA